MGRRVVAAFFALAFAASTAAQSASPSTSQPLGDVARQARQQNQQERRPSPKRVYTNDDIDAGPAHPDASSGPQDPRSIEGQVYDLRAQADKLADKHPRELSDPIVRDIQFPGRDHWEQQLYAQKQKFVSAAQVNLSVIEKLNDARTEEERQAAATALKNLLADMKYQKYLYDQLVTEGVKKAAEWERHR